MEVTPSPPEPLRPDPPHWTLWWVWLVFRPRRFFEVFVIDAVPVLTALTAWLYGIAGVMDRVETRSLVSPDSPLMALKTGWGIYWGACAALGIVGGALTYAIGGWWYRVRLRWSGVASPDAALARRVYVYAAQTYVVPFLLYTAWETLAYPTPLAASAGDDPWALFVLAALLWSVYVSYRGVRTAFEVRTWPARIWFGILPGALYGVAIVGVFLVALLSGWAFEPEPEVDRPVVAERTHYALEYPGNWLIDTDAPEYDPDSDFSIAPPFADALIRFWFYEESMDSRACVDATVENLTEVHDMGDLEPLATWGRYTGAGYRGEGTIEGKQFEFTLFCSTDGFPPFEIMQIVETDAVDRTAAGFDMIRESLKVRREN